MRYQNIFQPGGEKEEDELCGEEDANGEGQGGKEGGWIQWWEWLVISSCQQNIIQEDRWQFGACLETFPSMIAICAPAVMSDPPCSITLLCDSPFLLSHWEPCITRCLNQELRYEYSQMEPLVPQSSSVNNYFAQFSVQLAPWKMHDHVPHCAPILHILHKLTKYCPVCTQWYDNY